MRAVAGVLRMALMLMLAGILLGAGGTGVALAAVRLQAPVRALTADVAITRPWAAAPTTTAPILAPAQGSFALAAVFDGTTTQLAASNAQTVRPIASVAKTMTALAILDARPLLPGQQGPSLTITQQDVDDFHGIAAAGGSFAPVVLGERLSERDLLLGLMLPSANNFALTAARWIDGSVAGFVRRLNVRAVGLGMLHTHFADPDGLDRATTSTASDLVILARSVAGNSALIGVVSTINATLPDGTAVTNLNILLSAEPGWVGVKTGWTPDAGGCLLFAARRILAAGSPAVTVVGAVLGQPPDGNVDLAHPELGGAFDVARTSVDNAFRGLTTLRVGTGSIPVTGHIFASWGAYSSLRVSGPDRFVLLRAGDSLSATTATAPVSIPAAAGADAGSVTVHLEGKVIGTWRLTTSDRLAAPSPWWKLLRG